MNWGVFGRRRLGPAPHLAVCVSSTLASPININLRAYSFRLLITNPLSFAGKGRESLTGISSARYLTSSRESFEVTVSGGSTFARVKLKEIDGMAPQDVERAV